MSTIPVTMRSNEIATNPPAKTTDNTEEPEITTDVLIVGAGPAGASLASFLGFYGVNGIIISRDSSTAPQPRAHFTNSAAFECLRDVGLEDEFRKVGMSKEYYGDYRFCYNLAGQDIMRMHSFTRHPDRLGDYQEASPCEHGDVSQNVGEPVLLKYATLHGFQARFSCKFLSYKEDPSTGLLTSTIHDQLTGKPFQVVSKYVCGADGASSYVARQAGLQFHDISSGGAALNIWYEADLSHIYEKNPGLLHAISTPDLDSPPWGVRAVSRVVRPYTEFIMTLAAAPGVAFTGVTDEEIIARLRQLIGSENVAIKLKGIYRWKINEAYALNTRNGNVFCLGDAIHRHPPGGGLGSNTCIQDAYNLAWKLAFVLQGKAGSALLDSYDLERQPIAKRVVRIANDTFRTAAKLYHALGHLEPTLQLRSAAVKQLEQDTVEGAARRVALKEARENVLDAVTGLGGEMNQAYVSAAVNFDNEPATTGPQWQDDSNGVRYHVVSTFPGSRLPHAWLGTSKFGERISTHDVAGKGHFTLFTGINGRDAWRRAATNAQEAIGSKVEVVVRCIGPGQEFTDTYYSWEERRGVDEDGAVLVRPDRTIAWRCKSLNGVVDPSGRLATVLKKVLALS